MGIKYKEGTITPIFNIKYEGIEDGKPVSWHIPPIIQHRDWARTRVGTEVLFEQVWGDGEQYFTGEHGYGSNGMAKIKDAYGPGSRVRIISKVPKDIAITVGMGNFVKSRGLSEVFYERGFVENVAGDIVTVYLPTLQGSATFADGQFEVLPDTNPLYKRVKEFISTTWSKGCFKYDDGEQMNADNGKRFISLNSVPGSNTFLGIKEDGGTRTVYNGRIETLDDFKRIYELTS
jgi:hypothetical protein